MTLKNKIISSVGWSFFERLCVQLSQFIIGIILARILSPNDYGVFGILLIFITIFQLFIDSGFSKALIQDQKREPIDISTIFIFNLFISVLLYVILWFMSPYISHFFKIPNLTLLVRIISLLIIINAITIIPNTILTIDLNFKSIAIANFTSVLISGIIGIFLAKNDYGIWSMVYQTLIRSFLYTIIIFYLTKWYPILKFSISSLKKMIHFSSKLLLSSLLTNLVNNINSVIIAKYYTTKQLGIYSRGTQFTDVVYNTFSTTFITVLFPILSTLQNNKDQLLQVSQKAYKSIAIITIPFFFILLAISKPLIIFLLTDKWIEAIPIMQIFCIARLITIMANVNLNILYVLGRSDLALKQDFIKVSIRFTLLFIAFKYGIIIIAIAELAATITHYFINSYSPLKLLNTNLLKQNKDILPILISNIISLFTTIILIQNTENNLLKIILGAIFYLTINLSIHYILKIDLLFEIIRKLKSKLNHL